MTHGQVSPPVLPRRPSLLKKVTNHPSQKSPPWPIKPPPDVAQTPAQAPVPSSTELLNQLLQQGVKLISQGDFLSGEAIMRRVLEDSPDNASAWLWMGWATARQNKKRMAEQCLLRAQQLGHPKAAQALDWLRKQD